MVGIGPFLIPCGHVLFLGPSVTSRVLSPESSEVSEPSSFPALPGLRWAMSHRMLNVGRVNILLFRPGSFGKQ
jgi:hypothetical protein